MAITPKGPSSAKRPGFGSLAHRMEASGAVCFHLPRGSRPVDAQTRGLPGEQSCSRRDLGQGLHHEPPMGPKLTPRPQEGLALQTWKGSRLWRERVRGLRPPGSRSPCVRGDDRKDVRVLGGGSCMRRPAVRPQWTERNCSVHILTAGLWVEAPPMKK